MHCGSIDAQSGPLSYAVCAGDVATVTNMIDAQHADVNSKDGNGMTPLNVAFRTSTVYWDPGYNPTMISALLDRGANANATFTDGNTPLTDASYFGRLDVVTLLVTHGADVNLANAAGHTPLRQAAICDYRLSSDEGAAAVIGFLAAHGASAKAPTTEGANLLSTIPTPCSRVANACDAANVGDSDWNGYCTQTYQVIQKLVSN